MAQLMEGVASLFVGQDMAAEVDTMMVQHAVRRRVVLRRGEGSADEGGGLPFAGQDSRAGGAG